ncbi:hypothetical protein [Acinetobacter schindleri]|uniref:hypothetical protein n=1 Tax=Acinetobacter schindleri TaxID=108981 RepID=UPI0028A270C0|nr:hypothetical protein [Acinetobacter schindleri]
MKNRLFYYLALILLVGCQPFENNGYISIENKTTNPITDLKITYMSAQKTYNLGTLYPHSEYKYAINYEQHNEDSIRLSYFDKSHKKINQEIASYAAKYDRKNYKIIIQ